MKKNKTLNGLKVAMIGFTIAIMSAPVFAQKKIDMGDRFQINKDGSYITFTTTMGGFPVIKGSLKTYQATMFYDPEDVMASSATIRIGSAGFTTSHDKRDAELLGENFLDSERFPGIWFQGSEVKLTDTGFNLTGMLNIKNITKSATILVEKPTVMRKAMNLQDLMIVKGKLKINRKDFDLGTTGPWGANPMLGDEVEIEFSFLGTSYTIDYLQATFVNQKDGRENPVGLVYNDVKANGVDSGLKMVKSLSKDSKYKSDNWPTNLANIGWILMVDGYGKESLPFYELALKKNSKHLPSLLRLADAYTIAEQYDDALAHLEKEWALAARARFTHIPHLMKALSGSFELKEMR
ncbi:MAG: YceI family protein [Cyclobacteriaceae bacterium]